MKGRMASKKTERAKLVLTDWITANISFVLFNILRCLVQPEASHSLQYVADYLTQPKICAEQAFIPVLLLGLYWLSGFYNRPFGKSRFGELLNTAAVSCVSTILIHFCLLTNDQAADIEENILQLLMIFLIFFVGTATGRLIMINKQIRHFKKREWLYSTVVVGNSPKARRMARKLENSKSTMGHCIEGFFSIPGEHDADHEAWDLDDIEEICRSRAVDQIVLAPEKSEEDKVLELVYRLFPLGIPIKLTPETMNFMTSSIKLRDIYGQPLVDLTHSSMGESELNIKRAFDVTASMLTLIALSPVYLALSLWVKLDSPGPVFYRQERIGLHQKPFDIIKFRTMRTDAEAEGPQLCGDNDPRVTAAGRIMRKYRLDELPQFYNVLKGDMSIVGPRPERQFYISRIMRKAPYYTLLYQTRPGITSWGMVQYGYASTVDEMVERSKFDMLYISNMSILVDLKIMLYTVLTILEGRGK